MKKKIKIENLKNKHPLNKHIKIITDSYEDIFSDFDPRPFNVRELSDDFLRELERASVQKDEYGLLLTIMVPKNKRHIKEEDIIKKRIAFHISENCQIAKRKMARLKRKGIIFLVIGFTTMFLASLLGAYTDQHVLIQFLFVVLEPSGWFAMWTGFDAILDKTIKPKETLVFYRKMANCVIRFVSYSK